MQHNFGTTGLKQHRANRIGGALVNWYIADLGRPSQSPLGEISLLRRTGTVEDYAKQFVALACREVELSERQQVQLFIAGLVNPLRTDVAIQSPATLDDAIRYARAFEQRLALEPASQRQSGRAPFRPGGQLAAPGGQPAGVYAGPVRPPNQLPAAQQEHHVQRRSLAVSSRSLRWPSAVQRGYVTIAPRNMSLDTAANNLQ